MGMTEVTAALNSALALEEEKALRGEWRVGVKDANDNDDELNGGCDDLTTVASNMKTHWENDLRDAITARVTGLVAIIIRSIIILFHLFVALSHDVENKLKTGEDDR